MTTQAEHEAAADPFEKIRRRADQGPYIVDTCHGMVGGPAVLGPSGITGFMQGEENQRKAERLARDQNIIWACGYEAAVVALAADRAEAVRQERDGCEVAAATAAVNLIGKEELLGATVFNTESLVATMLEAIRARGESKS